MLQARRLFSFYISSIFRLMFIALVFVYILIFYYLHNSFKPQCMNPDTCHISKQNRTLPADSWGQTLYFKFLTSHFSRIHNEWRLSNVLDVYSKTEINCSFLNDIANLDFLAAGWTKSVYKIEFDNNFFALKVVNVYGHDITSCLSEDDRYLYDCFLNSALKLLREITILRSLSHPNVVQVLGYCIPLEPDIHNPLKTISIIEEYGESFDVIKMLQLSWEDRLRISLGLSRLLKHLASLKEPVALNDFRRQQFIFIDGEPKLIDVDDVGLQEAKCTDLPCCFSWSSSRNKSVCIPCVNGVCRGYNEKLNIMRTGSHFIRHILPHGAPSSLSRMALRMTSAFELGLWDSNYILTEMENMASIFIEGKYRNSSGVLSSGFKELKHHDLPAVYDFRCQLSSQYGCSFSVHDAEEAAEVCLFNDVCKAFVISDETTWTGRKMVYFKNGNEKIIKNNRTNLYIRL